MATRWEKAGTIAALVGVPISLAATALSYWQLESSLTSVKQQMRQEKASASMQVAASYLNSAELINAKSIINNGTDNGSDYSMVPQSTELYNAVQAVLNHLETTMTGVEVGVYSDGIVCQSLKAVVVKQVEVHLKGQRPTGVSKSNPQPFSASDFPNLSAIYERWSKQPQCPSE